MILLSVHNSITLEPVLDEVKDYGSDKFETAKEKLGNEELAAIGIKHTSLFWSLGGFAVALVLLLILFAIYCLVKYLRKRYPELQKVEDFLKKKLFYNSWIRYMITANLKLTHTSIFFLAITGVSFDSASDAVSSIFKISILILIVVWNTFMGFFLIFNRKHLEKEAFQNSYSSMYLGLKTDNYLLSYEYDVRTLSIE